MKHWLSLLLCLPPALFAAVPVTTAPLGELVTRVEGSAPATVVALNAPALSAEISARVESIAVRVGDRVSAGESLVSLDCRQHQSQLAAARASLADLAARRAFADNQLRRARDLQKKRSISEETLDQRQADLDSLKAQMLAQQQAVRQAGLEVERCEVAAPFDALVTARLADEGSLASPGSALIQLMQLDGLEVSARLRETEADSVEQAGELWFDYLDHRYPLSLRRLLPVVDEKERTREARLQFSEAAAPAGAAGRLGWRETGSVIPADYLVRREGGLGLFVFDEGKARFHVLTKAVEGQPAAVTLPEDTRVIMEGRQRVTDGEEVTEHKEAKE